MISSFTVSAIATSLLLIGNASANQVADFMDGYGYNKAVCYPPIFVEIDQISDYLLQNDMCYKLKTTAKQDAKIAAYNPAFLPIP